MRTFTISLAALSALTLSACGADAGAPDDAATASTEVRADRQLIFSDEFNDGELDRSKWTVIGMDFWVNQEEQAYVDSPDTIQFADSVEGADGGVLVLRPVYQPGQDTNTERNADFLSGRVESIDQFTFTYGRAEARIRMPDARGVWPAFWLLADAPWPSEGEIDIMEYVGEADWTGVAVHGPDYSGDFGIADQQYFPDGSDVTDWHVYAVEWMEDEIQFFVDDRLTFRIPRSRVEYLGEWVFDNPQGVILNFAVGGIYPLKINNITEPYTGMPQETADRIAAGEIAMEVDWVRVYGAE